MQEAFIYHCHACVCVGTCVCVCVCACVGTCVCVCVCVCLTEQGNVGLKCSNELREILQIAVETSATIAQPASSNMSFFCRPSELPGPTLDVQVGELTIIGFSFSPVLHQCVEEKQTACTASIASHCARKFYLKFHLPTLSPFMPLLMLMSCCWWK